MRIKETLKLLSIPLILMGIYLSMYAIWRVFDLPRDEHLLAVVKGWFLEYGLWIVFLGALIEGFLLLGQYFPGGFIIFIGVISAGSNIPSVIRVVSVVCLAFFISYTLNYLVGKYGWYKLLAKLGLAQSIEESKDKLTKQGLNVIFFSYWEPNLASLTATAAGILHVPLVWFSLYSAVGIILWNTFWGALVYNLGESAIKLVGFKYILIVFLIWAIFLILKNRLFKTV